LARYVAELAAATRAPDGVVLGASPRAALWLSRAARARALFEGRAFVLPDDVQALAHAVLDHRIVLEPRARLSGVTPAAVVERALERTPVPVLPAGAPPGAS